MFLQYLYVQYLPNSSATPARGFYLPELVRFQLTGLTCQSNPSLPRSGSPSKIRPAIPPPLPPTGSVRYSRHGDNLSVLRPGSPSITVLVFPDFADAYSRRTASYRLTQLSGQIPESSQFLGASKLVSMLELRCITTQFRLPPNLCLCKLPLCNDSVLS
jgi:hypothetical protein